MNKSLQGRLNLYVILDMNVCRERGNIAEIAGKVIAGGADAIQLRAKNTELGEIIRIGKIIKGLLQGKNILYMINDFASAADNLAADGVHLGQNDLPVENARRIVGTNKIIGLSTHSLQQAQQAEKQGADYIGVGPIFSTAAKPEMKGLSPRIITEIQKRTEIPFIAIGGINLNNLGQVLAAGARNIAVCRAVICADDVRAATREFKRKLSITR